MVIQVNPSLHNSQIQLNPTSESHLKKLQEESQNLVPSLAFEGKFFELMFRLELLNYKISHCNVKALEFTNFFIKQLTEESITATQNASQAANSEKNWSHIDKIASAFTTCLALAGGFFACPEEINNQIWKHLCVSFGAGMVHLAMGYTNGWERLAQVMAGNNQEAKNKLQIMLPLFSTIASVITGFGVANHLSAMTDLPIFFKGAAGSVQVCTQLTNAYSKFNLGQKKLEQLKIEGKLSDKEEYAKLTLKITELIFEQLEQLKNHIREILKATIHNKIEPTQ